MDSSMTGFSGRRASGMAAPTRFPGASFTASFFVFFLGCFCFEAPSPLREKGIGIPQHLKALWRGHLSFSVAQKAGSMLV